MANKAQMKKYKKFTFRMIDNYIYLYHTQTLIAIPTFPETLQDSMGVEFSAAAPLSRSAPIYSYVKSGPRTVQITLDFHRDMFNDVNLASSNLNVPNLSEADYVDIMINQLQSMALPRYAAGQKMVDPPLIAVRFGNELFCKGVVTDSVSTTFSGPILRTNKYAQVSVSFTVSEVDPYDALMVSHLGSFRGLSTDLERNVWKTAR